MRLTGGNHVNLTVRDLDRSTEWYCRVLRLAAVSDEVTIGPPYFTDVTYRGLFDLRTGSYVVGLIRHPVGLADEFDARRVGLDHVGWHVPERADLEGWVTHLDAHSVPHSGIVDAPYATVVSFHDPDGIALELSVAKPQFWAALLERSPGA